MTGSALYAGRILHRRPSGPEHAFAYGVWYLLLDLDEIPALAASIPIFSHNRFNLVGFDDRDHLRPERRPVREKLAHWLADMGAGIQPDTAQLLAHPRVLGSVFNPVSFFFCRDPAGVLTHVVAEVHNTFGETFCYLLEHDGGTGVVRHEADKVFHVSPFQPVEGRYRFRVTPPGERLTVHIEVERNGTRAFDATLRLERSELTARSLAVTALRHPHTGLRTLGLIHLQALRLWRRGARFYSKPEPPAGAWRTRP